MYPELQAESVQYTVTVTSRDRSAFAGTDYGVSSGVQTYTVTFPTGSTDQSFTVNTLSDSVWEFNEVFDLNIQRSITAGLTVGSVNRAEVTITDTTVLQVQYSTDMYSGSEEARFIPVTVSLVSGSLDWPIRVEVVPSLLTPPSASNNDFTSSSVTAVFSTGSISSTISIPVSRDNIVEGPETFNLGLRFSDTTITAGARSTATGQIDDSTMVTVRFTETSYSGSELSGVVDVDIELVGGTSTIPFDVTVTPSQQSPPSATGGNDFSTAVLTASFASGATSATVSVPVFPDGIVEEDEQFDLTLSLPPSTPTGINLGRRRRATGIIIDSTITVNFQQVTYRVSENRGPLMVGLVLDSPLTSSTTVTLTRQDGTATDIKERLFYICCRSGHYQENTRTRITSKRRHNQKDGRKINDTCLSRIYVNHFNDGHVEIEYIPAHTGHELNRDEINYIPLPENAKEEIATKLSLGVNPSRILSDARGTVGDRRNRDLFDENLARQHVMTKTDIKNIETKVKDFSIKRHQNDATSVNLIVEELRNEPYNPVLIYKPQGRAEPQFPTLQDETFVLAIQTKFQKDLYEAHASTILCIDSTHGMNQYRFKLITCVVPDDHGKGM
ncbi:FRAS1-related extracellular matrix protein 2-like isoform X2 [Dysidea avara]|uniref:FRAS1-related extracellular matrix protein 2-like isoform X2 n=1 Tax=Dysidea avara TaxID=196820 RepID=UPI0033275E60